MNRLLALVAALALLAGATRAAFAADYPPVPPAERLVGIAYSTWHNSDGWWNHCWGTPELGRYLSTDRAVIRQHAEWLADAGVDFVFVDWSNNINYDPANKSDKSHQAFIEQATNVLFEEWSKLERAPKIAIMAGVTLHPEAAQDGRLQKKADQIHDWYLARPEYRKIYQDYLGKPLLIVYVNTPSPFQRGVPEWTDPRFTVRWMTGYVTEQGNLRDGLVSKYGYWSWEDRREQTFAVHDGRPEAMTVVATWRQQAKPGDRGYIPTPGRAGGETFRRQWERARAVGPRVALVVSWNEWTRGEQPSAEISKDIEPSQAHGKLYLNLLKEEIRKFKGGTTANTPPIAP